jgi:translation initiation factor 2 beta subunit (eIF-2beta)/eIF-5
MKHIDLGFIDVPIDYTKFDERQKKVLCDRLIDTLIQYIDNELEEAPQINRINLLQDVLESSLVTNEYLENYEVCGVIKDMITRLNEA